MVVLKPKGRGGWSAVTMAIEGRRIDPLLVRVGETLIFAGVVWRICKVLP